MDLGYGRLSGYSLLSEDRLQYQKQTKPWTSDLGLKIEIVVPFLGKYRPFVGRCCQRCTPKSWESFFHKNLVSLGFCSVLKITEKDTRYRGWLVRRLCYFLAVKNWTFGTENSSDLQEKIFRSQRVREVVYGKEPPGKEDAPAGGLSVTQWMAETRRILCQICGSLSPLLLRFCHWLLLKLLNRMCLGVIVHKGQLEMVRRATRMTDAPMVFLSTHKSQLDGLLLQLLLVSQGLPMPRVAYSYKAFTPDLRALLTRLGGVFLPPGVEQPPDSKEGALSRAVVASYIEDLLRSQQPLLIFLEDAACAGALQRSASGNEWLSLVVGAFHAGSITNVRMVSIGISYDVAPNLQFGNWKSANRTVSLWTSLWAICQALRQGLGCVRVDFAQPASLQEYVANNFYRQSCSGKSAEEFLLPEVLGKSPSALDGEESERSTPGSTGVLALNAEQRLLVEDLGLHSLIAGASCSSLMAVEIMAALLLHKYLEGVFLSRLMQDFAWLTEELLLRNYDVGFSGRVRDVALHGLFLLRRCVSLRHLSLGDILVVPKRTEEALSQLNQHSMALLPAFIQEAIGACAVNALLVEMLPYLGSPEQLQEVILLQDELYNKTFLLAQLLPRGLLQCQPCQSVDSYCQVAVDKLIQCGLLVAEEVPGDLLPCDTTKKRFAEKLLWKPTECFGDSDSDFDEEEGKQHFKVSHLDSFSSFFVFLCHLLGPLLKTLERAAAFLKEMESPQPESQYLEKLHQFLGEMAKEGCSCECVNWTLVTLSVQIFKDLGVLREVTSGPRESVLHLSDTFAAKENQEKLEKFINQFIYT